MGRPVGLRDRRGTGEGVFGLRRAFEVAGARTVIMSLWSVKDVETSDWMHRLYEGSLKGLSSSAVLEERRTGGLDTHPSHWGAFVAVGDWR